MTTPARSIFPPACACSLRESRCFAQVVVTIRGNRSATPNRKNRTWIKMSAITIKLDRRIVFAIGLMSGTSHDGVSAAVVELDERSRPSARLIAFHTFPYPARFRKELLAASADEKIGAAAISTLNFALGREFGRAAIEIARRAHVALSDVALIGSHGHTFFHLRHAAPPADRSPP